MKKNYLFLFIFFLILPPVFAKSYHISNADLEVIVLNNGLINVTETRTYDFTGCYSIIYRNIPEYNDSKVLNFKGSSEEKFTLYEENRKEEYYYEYRFTKEQCDKKVTVINSYQMNKVINTYDDVSELHFMFWGDEEPRTKELSFTLVLPDKVINYWIHPFYGFGQEYIGEDNKVFYKTSSSLPAGRWVEVRAIFPRINTDNVNIKEGNGREKIENIEKKYRFRNLVSIIINYSSPIIFLLPIILYLYLYYKHGLEPKVMYNKPYEREPPTEESPAVVNAKINSDKNAQPNIDAFLSTIFDLVNKGYINLSEISYYEKRFLGEKEVSDIVFTILDKDESELADYEKDVIKFLRKHAKFQKSENKVYWKKMEKKLKTRSYGLKFRKFFNKWKNKVDDKVDEDKHFIPKGKNAFNFFATIYVLLLVIFLYNSGGLLSYLNNVEAFYINTRMINYMSIAGLVITIILAALPAVILGRRTREGTIYYLRWMKFKEFLDDFSLLKEHPPGSVEIWEKYMVYAITLGVADKVIKVMKLYIPKKSRRTHYTYFYGRPRMFYSMHSIFYASSRTTKKSSSSYGSGGFGGGGFGGGFGGGGSGAR